MEPDVFLGGGGGMGARVRAYDWSTSPLGSIESWPQSLRTALSIMLSSAFPSYLVWGPRLISFYNDAYVPILGTKPDALGKPFREVWPEVWDEIGPITARAMAGEASFFEDYPLTLVRRGSPEQTWFTFSYSPIRDESGGVGGVLCTVHETTSRIVGERERERLLQELAAERGRFLTLVENLPFSAGMFDREGGLVAGNPALHALLPRGLVPSRDPDARPEWTGYDGAGAALAVSDYPVSRALEGQVVRNVAFVHRPPDGGERWMDVSCIPIREAGGRVTHVVLVIQDVDEPERAKRALRESEARLSAAVDLVGLSPYTWDPVADELHWDDRLKAMWGLPPDARVSVDAFRAGLHPDDRERVEAAIASCADPAGDGAYQLEYRVIGIGDGVERWVSTYGRTSFRGDQPVWFVGAALEITERKRAEERLRESEERFRQLANLVPAFVWFSKADGTVNYVNERFYQYTGQAREPGSEVRWAEALHPDDAQLVLERWRAARDQGGVYEAEHRMRRHDGAYRWHLARAEPLRDEGGRITGWFGTSADIHDRKDAEERLADSEARFRQFAEYSADVLWILDLETGRLEFLSAAYEVIWGEPADALLGDRSRWLGSVHPDDRERAASALRRARDGEVSTLEYRIVRPDGTIRRIRDTAFPIRDDRGRIMRLGGIAEDVTEFDGSRIYVVDGDEGARQDLVVLLQAAGYQTQEFPSAKSFLEVAPVLMAGCVVLNARPPGSAPWALAVPAELKARRIGLPVVVIGTSGGDVRMAVQAMKAGAADWIEAPCEGAALLSSIASAVSGIRAVEERNRSTEGASARIAQLSGREREVLEGLLDGGTNKVIARRMGLSPRTVELHRAHVMERLGAKTLSELVAMAIAAGMKPSVGGAARER